MRIFVGIILASWILVLGLAHQAAAADAPQGKGPWVVRATFDNQRSLALLLRRAAPWRVDREKSEVLIEVNDAFEWRMMEREGFTIRVDSELTRAFHSPPAKIAGQIAGIPGYICYRTVEETYDAAITLVANNPNLAEWIDIGDSWKKQQNPSLGYDLRVLRITNRSLPGPKPALFLQSALHAREYVTAESVTRFAEFMLAGYGTDPDRTWIIDHHDIQLLLVANPDGRKVAETAATRSQRKNRNENYCSAGGTSLGVDLNRNYPWSYGLIGSSTDPCSTVFRGPMALSEPETTAITNYVRTVFPDQRAETSLTDRTTPISLDANGFYIDVHSNGAGNWFPWGDAVGLAPNSTEMQTLARKLQYFNGYQAIQSALTGAIGGASDDYTFGTLGIPAFTLELGGSDFWPACSTFEASIVNPVVASLYFSARIVRAPYRLPSGPELTGVVASPAVVAQGGNAQITATANDARYGAGTGPEPTQNIQQVAVFTMPPWQLGATPVGLMLPVDGTLNSAIEAMQFTLPASALTSGRQLVYVQATDAAGNAGPVSAVFVELAANLFSNGFEP